MSFSAAAAQRNKALDAALDDCNSGSIKVYAGTPPADADAALGGATLLATLTFGATAFGAASGGVKTANAIGSGVAGATGTASFFRAYKSDGTTVVYQGSVGTSGADLNLNTTSVTTGSTVSCSSLTITMTA